MTLKKKTFRERRDVKKTLSGTSRRWVQRCDVEKKASLQRWDVGPERCDVTYNSQEHHDVGPNVAMLPYF